MARKLEVKKMMYGNKNHHSTARMSGAETMMVADRIEQMIEEKIKRKERGESTPDEEVEVITEWL